MKPASPVRRPSRTAHLDTALLAASMLGAAALAGACGDDGATAGTGGSDTSSATSAGATSGQGGATSAGQGGGSATGGGSEGGGTSGTFVDLPPFAAQPDASGGLTNVSADLGALLENGALAGACAAYQADPANLQKRLLCGKAMFFYEGFGTAGVPKPLITWLLQSFPAELGPGFQNLGMIADPNSPEKLPLGLAKGAPIGTVESLAFTCASCHFGRLPDGRYAVGAPNHDYDYGRMNLVIALLPSTAMPGWSDAAHDPEALAELQPMRAKLDADFGLKISLGTALLPLITGGTSIPAFSKENEGHYARWKTGTMDFFIQPLPYDDGVHTISKISALWGVPDAAELGAHSLPSAMLGWTGGTSSLPNFLHSFVGLRGERRQIDEHAARATALRAARRRARSALTRGRRAALARARAGRSARAAGARRSAVVAARAGERGRAEEGGHEERRVEAKTARGRASVRGDGLHTRAPTHVRHGKGMALGDARAKMNPWLVRYNPGDFSIILRGVARQMVRHKREKG